MLSWKRIAGALLLPGALLAACGEAEGGDGVGGSGGAGAGGGTSAGAGGSGGGGLNMAGSAGCGEITPARVGCAERYEDQRDRSCIGWAEKLTGSCGSYQGWICSGTPSARCIYDREGAIVYWQYCDDVPLCGARNYCRENGLNGPGAPACELTSAGPTPDAGDADAGDAAVSDAAPDEPDASNPDGG